jgi:hypothetical protein
MIAGIRTRRLLGSLSRVFIISTVCIAAYCVVYLLLETGVLHPSRLTDLMLFDWESSQFALADGYILMQVPGLNSVPFLVPYVLAILVTVWLPGSGGTSLARRLGLWATLFSGLVVVLLSGRRAFYVVTLTAPGSVLLFSCFLPRAQWHLCRKALFRATATGVLVIVLVVVSVGPAVGVSFGSLSHRLAVSFDFSSTTEDGGASQRNAQFQALLSGWTDNMFFGVGHGSPVYGYYSSAVSPWSFELGYMALLYQIGLVGVAALAAGVLWIYWMGVRVIRTGGDLSGIMIACLSGMSAMLFAHATNPYLARFDGMWALFFPLAVVNVSLFRNGTQQTAAAQQAG